MTEQGVMRAILLACSRGAARLFRQNVGTGWVGESTRFSRASTVSVQQGDVLIRNARPLHAGLCEGSSDLIGWRTVEVTPKMVGQRLAVFAAVEVKSERGRPTTQQKAFITAVSRAGGIAGVARSVEDAEKMLRSADERSG